MAIFGLRSRYHWCPWTFTPVRERETKGMEKYQFAELDTKVGMMLISIHEWARRLIAVCAQTRYF